MDLDTIGAALRRKLGPLPVWIWAILGGVVVYWLRKRGYFGGILGSDTGTALQPSQTPITDPQPLQSLQPGESVYDPNTGALTTAPGGDTGTGIGDGGGGTGTDPTQAIEDLAAAISSGRTEQGPPANSTAPRTSLLSRAKAAVVRGRVGPKGRSRLHKEGYSDAQINFHTKHHTALGKPATEKPKRSVSKKPAHSPPKPTTKKDTHKTRPRGTTNTRTPNGGRTTGRKAKPSPALKPAKARTATAASATGPRQRPTTALVRHNAPVQHPVSSHTPARQSHEAPAHRPSQPAPRTVRQPPPPKPTPKRKKR